MVSLLEWANCYLDHCKLRFVHNTYQEKVKAFRLLFRSVSPEMLVSDLSQGQILQHFSGLVDSGRSGNAVNHDRKNLVAAWNWACKYIADFPSQTNPFLVEKFPETRHPRYVPPLSDFWQVLEHVETEQDRVLLLSYLYLAARRSELFRLRLDDVDLPRQRVQIGTRKRADGGLEYDWLPIAGPLLPELTVQVERVPGPWVFPHPGTGNPYVSRNKWMGRLCGAAAVRPFGLHAIRHLTASILAEQGVPLVQIQQILRHKRLTTTERYIRSLGGCREAVSVLPLPPA